MDKLLTVFKNAFSKVKLFYKKYFEIINPTLVLAVICIAVTLALSSANLLTKGTINRLAEENKKQAMVKLIVADEYPEKTAKLKLDNQEVDVTYNIAVKDGKTVAYIFTVSTSGYGGDVTVMTAVNVDGTVAAVDILDASGETPGFGQNVKKPEFYTQYNGLKSDVKLKTGGKASKENNEINAVTSATISSKAVTKSVNQALGFAAQINAKGDTE